SSCRRLLSGARAPQPARGSSARASSRAGQLAVWCGVALCAIACRRPVQADEGFPRDQTLYVGGFQWSQPSTFNPLDQSPSWPLNPHTGQNLFYEPLLLFNASSGEIEPMLARSYAVRDDAVEVELQPAARFADGSPV